MLHLVNIDICWRFLKIIIVGTPGWILTICWPGCYPHIILLYPFNNPESRHHYFSFADRN